MLSILKKRFKPKLNTPIQLNKNMEIILKLTDTHYSIPLYKEELEHLELNIIVDENLNLIIRERNKKYTPNTNTKTNTNITTIKSKKQEKDEEHKMGSMSNLISLIKKKIETDTQYQSKY